MSAQAWRVAAASVVGTGHRRRGEGCQDSHQYRVIQALSGQPLLVAAVADGAGSATQGGEGADICAGTMVQLLSERLGAEGESDLERLSIARACFCDVRRHLTRHVETAGGIVRDYATTLIAAAVAPDFLLTVQIGDGAAVATDKDAVWRWIHWPQHGEFANVTRFVTDLDAEAHVMIELRRGCYDAVALFTDGLEPLLLDQAKRRAHAPFFDGIFAPLRGPSTAEQNLDKGLAAYLDSTVINRRTDDDKTLLLAWRMTG